MAGDFNQLNIPEVTARTRLIPLVKVPTRGSKTLDMFMSTPPQRHNIKVVSSSVRSDHKAVLATAFVSSDRSKTSKKKLYRRRTPSQHASLMNDLRSFDDPYLLTESDPETAWNAFYSTIWDWLDRYYPLRQISVTSREPPFMTPDTKFLLRKKNRLMRQGRAEEASAIAIKVGRAVARFSSRELRRLVNSVGTKKLWECVNNRTNPREDSEHRVNFSADELNNHYASISTDPAYQEVRWKLTANPQLETFSEMQIFTALDRLRPTAEGIDRLPAWYLRLLAPICARSLASLINLSLGCSFVPQQ